MSLGTTIINSREDLDALEGTMEHAEFMQLLESSLWLIRRDDSNQCFIALEDNSIIEKYGFVRADFPNAAPPDTPAWIPLASTVPQTVTPFQAKAALLNAGILNEVTTAINESSNPIVKLAWDTAQEYKRSSPMVEEICKSIGWSESQLDALFIAAAKITA